MNESKWINAPQPGRLRVRQLGDNVVTFIDAETKESVTVYAPGNLLDAHMSVTASRLTRPVFRQKAKHYLRGEFITQRDVWHFVTRDHATALRAGLTIHRSAFSSTPHVFELTPQLGFEEVFYFLLPNGGKGILEGDGLWPDGSDVNAAWPFYHRNFAQVPMGWHRVVAMAEADGRVPRVAYVWAYLALPGRGWEKNLD